jgi:hypothetical protein
VAKKVIVWLIFSWFLANALGKKVVKIATRQLSDLFRRHAP